MTALKKYQKLESLGLWRDAPQDQRRNVVVSFGAASLILSDPKTDLALSHWSLPALERRNPGDLPAIYAPGHDAAETLELDDADMIAALETVQAALATRKPRPGRLRGTLIGIATLSVLGLGVFWLPGALIKHTAAVVPAAKRAEIGELALRDVIRLTGAPCAHPLGQKALAEMSERLFGPANTPILLAVREGPTPALHLPGDVIVLSGGLFEAQNGPQAAAGAALAEQARAMARDPLIPVLEHAGLVATVRLLTTGDLPEGALNGYGEKMLNTPPFAVAPNTLLASFANAGVPSTPFAQVLRANTPEAAFLVQHDPFAKALPPALMPDEAWVSLQAICDE
jgi:hypothetical protein